ncbi:MAG: transcription antitermination factor NusB [Cyanobacteria bacterium J06597_16]
MKARSIAREMALLGISQLTDNPDKVKPTSDRHSLSANQLDGLLVKALAALSADVTEAIETAEGELQRGERLILESETRTVEADKMRSRIEPAIPLVETAINRVGSTLEFLVFAQQGDKQTMAKAQASLESAATALGGADQTLADTEQRIADISEVRSQIQRAIAALRSAISDLRGALSPDNLKQIIDRSDIRQYACDLLDHWIHHWRSVDRQLDDAMEKWNIRRLARVDRDILRLAMMEIIYMDVPKSVAIDEAIEMAKRYSDEDSYRFINGVLRRTTDKLEAGSSDAEVVAQSAATQPVKVAVSEEE